MEVSLVGSRNVPEYEEDDGVEASSVTEDMEAVEEELSTGD